MPSVLLTLLLLAVFAATPAAAQFGGGGGFGGPQQDLQIVKVYDKDGDGRLNREERQAARAFAALQPRRGGGFRRNGRAQVPAGPKLSPDAVKIYSNEPLYDPKVLRTLFIDFEDADWETEMADFYRTDVDIPATLTVDGKVYKEIGVHFRGNSSYSTVPAGLKRSLNLSLNYAHAKQNLGGYRTINLLNSHLDPTYMRTAMYMQIARQYIPAPQANWMRVVINGESWGVYVAAEQFNADFTEENYHSRKGARWHVPGSPRTRGGLGYMGDDPAAYRRIFEIKSKDTPESWAALMNLSKTLTNTPIDKLQAALEPILDIDGALKFLALDKALINDDGYWIRQSDYNIYMDEKGRFHVIPHDANETLREPEMGFGGGANSGMKLDPFYGTEDSGKVLYRLLQIPTLRAKYLAYMKDIAENWMDWRKMGPMVREYQALISADVKTDTHKLDNFDDFVAGAASLAQLGGGGGGFMSPPAFSLRAFFEQRREYLLSYTEPKKQ